VCRVLVMDTQSQLTVDIITKVALGKISITNASKFLNKPRRTIERYLKRYNTNGIQFVVHAIRVKHPRIKYPIQ
jgi:transposase